MSTLLLRLAASMQAWGSDFRFEVRRTGREPTKSGVIGLLAAALGRSRADSIDDLCQLRFGVRVDQEGQLLRDFHTAHQGAKTTYVTQRYYLCDAVFLVGLESKDEEWLQELDKALQSPIYPLFLGRRSCPPTLPLTLGIREENLVDALKKEPWQASLWMQRRLGKQQPKLRLMTDAHCGGRNMGLQRDLPVTFHNSARTYTYRGMEEHFPVIPPEVMHDPMSELS
ncbi:type I-E CRISPR-associated protein Cas5/CasD [Clostridium phoceensis]|uniref:type I-E CRISPR-associated protein Cas5/CasD n=1 Tax=Clostridium phoceensis TaxID=1650661 RepID=UPI00067F1E48|nr:type I-E CRISPR-associated protein Cas5/CasD [Clostridium phoceensis]